MVRLNGLFLRLSKLKTIILVALFLVPFTVPANAQQDREDTLKATVFTSRRQANSLSKGKELRTEVISSAGLMKLACCNLAESFENSASVTVGYSDAVTGARQIRLLGLSGVYLQMLEENRPVMRGLSAPFGLSFVPGPWMESIQIAKGSPSVINGTESMTGQINTEFRKPTDEIPLFINVVGMSDTKTDFNLASSLQFGEKLSTIILGHAEGNFKSHDMNMDGFMDDPMRKQVNVGNRWFWYTPELQIRWGGSALYDSRLGGQEYHGWQSDITNTRLNGYIKIGKPLREDNSASVAVIGDYTYNNMDAGFGPSAYSGRQHSGFINLMFRDAFSENHDFSAGLSTMIDSYNESLDRYLPTGVNNSFSPITTNLVNARAYAEYTFHTEDTFSAIIGLNGDWFKDNGFRLSPRVTLKYQPFESVVLRANGGRGLRNALPLVDHFGVFSTGKGFIGNFLSHQLEDSWTYGGNATFYFNEDNYLSLDYFSTRFSDQLIVDYELAPGQIAFYPLDGKSLSDSYQADFHLEPSSHFTIDLTARYTDARTTYMTEGLREVPLTSRFKGVANFQYKTNLSRWIFDLTGSVNGSSRVYDFMRDLKDENGKLLYPEGRTPVYPLVYAQVTRRFKGFDIYLGGENLTGFRQKNVILGEKMADGMVDTATSDFDASAVWGPLMGATVYAGIRVTIWKTE